MAVALTSPPDHDDRDARGPDGDRPAGGGGRKRRKDRPQDFSQLTMMLERFVLLYGTRTVFDREKHLLMTLEALGAAYPTWQRFWREHTDRQMVDADRVVFEPGRKLGPEWLNLWKGWESKPKKGECRKILELLHHLVGGNVESMAWILRWIAFPLRHAGAKMRTAIIMHGDEGSGKNLFWEIVRRIYGRYGVVITQDQLEDRFNGWISGKLFAIADEVVSRQEMRHVKGRLKSYITSTELIVNEKHLAARTERNCLNFVFLSNEVQPLQLDESDRRYHVEWTPPRRDRAFYDAVAAEADAGGLEAFYHYLMHDVQLGEFDEHTRPLATGARERLIDISRPSPQAFWTEWSAEELPVPFCACKTRDLYRAYEKWCARSGERFPARLPLFVREMERYVPKGVKWISGEKQATVFLVNPDRRPENMIEAEWLRDCIGTFLEGLGSWS